MKTILLGLFWPIIKLFFFFLIVWLLNYVFSFLTYTIYHFNVITSLFLSKFLHISTINTFVTSVVILFIAIILRFILPLFNNSKA